MGELVLQQRNCLARHRSIESCANHLSPPAVTFVWPTGCGRSRGSSDPESRDVRETISPRPALLERSNLCSECMKLERVRRSSSTTALQMIISGALAIYTSGPSDRASGPEMRSRCPRGPTLQMGPRCGRLRPPERRALEEDPCRPAGTTRLPWARCACMRCRPRPAVRLFLVGPHL